ncbi:hypothetical protein U9M48_025325 [Paspalum notatum var. saurae]|uniref:Uncharacterized protein n=1 Tax=Paspalum notatum var. saurae TaxID=547442 RepID=A0AAQ3TQ62_PASNO
MGKIDKLKQPNYPTWRKDIDMMFTLTNMDFALLYDKPTEPASGEARYDDKMLHYSIEKRKWKISNTKCLKIIRHLIDDSIEGSIPECATAKELLDRLKSQFTGSSKAYASTLVDDFTTRGHYKKECPDWLRSLIPKDLKDKDKGLQTKEDAEKGQKKR